jgi:uridine phosphorylase
MPARLRPTAPIAADAILVGDPGRALLLAQTLLEQPKMSNHARGLWGYTGRTAAGRELTLQSTGMGGPSAALVLDDLAELGVRRAVRVGTCLGLGDAIRLGELLVVSGARPRSAVGGPAGEEVAPDAPLTAELLKALGGSGRTAAVASFDRLPRSELGATVGADAADMQTAALLAHGAAHGVAVAAVLIVTETSAGGSLADEALERTARTAGEAAAAILSG